MKEPGARLPARATRGTRTDKPKARMKGVDSLDDIPRWVVRRFRVPKNGQSMYRSFRFSTVCRRRSSCSSCRAGRFLVAAVVGAWVVAAAVGFALLSRYSWTPGECRASPTNWPADGPVARDERRATVLMFLHPRCPCSRASVQQFGALVHELEDRLAAWVFLYQPAGASEAWGQGELVASVKALRGVRVLTDPEGSWARRFGVITSGGVLVYDRAGELRFSGGITPLRGHTGDSLGGRAIRAIAAGDESAGLRTAPIFGCPLFDEGREGLNTGAEGGR